MTAIKKSPDCASVLKSAEQPMLREYDSICGQCFLALSSVCSALGAADLRRLEAVGERQLVPRGQVASLSKRNSAAVVIVRRGGIKVSFGFTDGQEQIIDLLSQGDAFLLSGDDESANRLYRSVSDTELCTVWLDGGGPESRLDARLHLPVVAALRSEINRKTAHQLMLGRRRPEQRLAMFLLDRSTRSGSKNGIVALPESRRDIADHLCLSIETVSRTMTRMRTASIVETPDLHTARILDSDALLAIIDGGFREVER